MVIPESCTVAPAIYIHNSLIAHEDVQAISCICFVTLRCLLHLSLETPAHSLAQNKSVRKRQWQKSANSRRDC